MHKQKMLLHEQAKITHVQTLLAKDGTYCSGNFPFNIANNKSTRVQISRSRWWNLPIQQNNFICEIHQLDHCVMQIIM